MAISEEQMSRVEPSIRRESGPVPAPERLRERELRTTAELVAGGSLAETVGAGAAVVLSIVGLAGIYPAYLAPVAAIAIGGALLLQGAAIAARYHAIAVEAARGTLSEAELGGGMTTEFLGGAAGVVLGILALLNIVPTTLLAVTVIAFGGTLLLGSGATARLNALMLRPGVHDAARWVAREAVNATTGAQALVGGAAIVLGILALVGYVPSTLILVALLAIGSAAFLTGAAVSGRMMLLFRRTSPNA